MTPEKKKSLETLGIKVNVPETDARASPVPFKVGDLVNTIDGIGIYKGVQTDPKTGEIINIFVEINGEEVGFRHLDQEVWSMAPRGSERARRR